MDIVERIVKTIEPSIESMGYRLVQVKLAEGSRRKALLIMAERIDDKFMSFDDCTTISQTVSALLDVDDPITTAYDLEVMSPGLDRPLTKLADFERYAGYEIKCETLIPVENRKRFKGILKGIKGETISLDADTGAVELQFGNLRSAKISITDNLVRDTLQKQKKEEEERIAAEKAEKAARKKKKATK